MTKDAIVEQHFVIKNVPNSLVALRNELPFHPEISAKAQKGRTFEECIAIIAGELLIVMDGFYDVADLCDMLCTELQRKRLHIVAKRDPRLVSARLTVDKDSVTLDQETEGGVLLVKGAETPEEVESTETRKPESLN